MYNGERPIGASKGKPTNTMASCQNPPSSHNTSPHRITRVYRPAHTDFCGLLPFLHQPKLPPQNTCSAFRNLSDVTDL